MPIAGTMYRAPTAATVVGREVHAISAVGSGDSGAAGGPSSSAIKMPASTKPAPSSALLPSLSRSKMYEVTEANTGSSVNKIAAWLEVVYCCAQSWIEKAKAVASTAQMAIPRSDSDCQPKRAGCQPDAEAKPVASHARAAQAATWSTLRAATECRRV